MRRHDSGCAQPQLGFLLADADEREREARIRELRLLAVVYFGPDHAITSAFSAALGDPAAIDKALELLHQAPALRRRRLLFPFLTRLVDATIEGRVIEGGDCFTDDAREDLRLESCERVDFGLLYAKGGTPPAGTPFRLLESARWLAEQIDDAALEQIKARAEAKLAEMRTEIEAINRELRMATDGEFELPPIDIPEPEIDATLYGKPLASSAWPWSDQTRALKSRKGYLPEGESP
jgi:hypothetical protein